MQLHPNEVLASGSSRDVIANLQSVWLSRQTVPTDGRPFELVLVKSM
jgi:hypothetical protein